MSLNRGKATIYLTGGQKKEVSKDLTADWTDWPSKAFENQQKPTVQIKVPFYRELSATGEIAARAEFAKNQQRDPAKYPQFEFPAEDDQNTAWFKSVIDEQVIYEELSGIWTEKVNIEAGKYVLHKLAERTSAVLEEDWKSMEISIGSSGDEISIKSLYDVDIIYDPDWKSGTTGRDRNASNTDLLVLVCDVLTAMRAGLIDVGREYGATYRAGILERCKVIFAQITKDTSHTPQNNALSKFANDKSLKVLTSCYDMFFSKFPTHDLAKLRIGTIQSFQFGYGAWTSLFAASISLGVELYTISTYLWEPRTFSQYMEMTKEGEELERPDSYAKYVAYYGGINASKYSSSHRANTHTWSHTVGIICGNLWSERAIMLPGVFGIDSVYNSVIFLMVNVGGNLKRQAFLAEETRGEWEKIQAAHKKLESARQEFKKSLGMVESDDVLLSIANRGEDTGDEGEEELDEEETGATSAAYKDALTDYQDLVEKHREGVKDREAEDERAVTEAWILIMKYDNKPPTHMYKSIYKKLEDKTYRDNTIAKNFKAWLASKSELSD